MTSKTNLICIVLERPQNSATHSAVEVVEEFLSSAHYDSTWEYAVFDLGPAGGRALLNATLSTIIKESSHAAAPVHPMNWLGHLPVAPTNPQDMDAYTGPCGKLRLFVDGEWFSPFPAETEEPAA